MMRHGMILLLMVWMLAALAHASGGNDWLADFNESCAKTYEAMDLSREELLSLITKCERVKKAVESQDETVRKVYLKRVQMCLDLFRYVLETKTADEKSPTTAAPAGTTGQGAKIK